MSEKTMSTSKEKEKSEFSPKSKINLGNKFINSKELKKIKKEEDYILDYSNDLLNENIKLSPMINPIPCFTVKKENSTKDEISTQNTFYSNNNNHMNINTSYNIKEENENKKDKTKILNKNLKIAHLNNYIYNNRYFRQYSPNFEINNTNQINSYGNRNKLIHNKMNYEIFFSNKKKLVNNINKKKIINQKYVISGIKRNKFLNRLYFSTDNFYESNNFEEKLERLEEKKEQKRIKIKLLCQKINVATIKIEILQSYKKNKNINTIKKKIEYNKIYCNNDLKRLKDNYYININSHMNQRKYMKMKLLKCQEDYMPINQHLEEIKKEELNFKIKKMELIEKILFLRKKLNDKLNTDLINRDNNINFDDSFEEKTINDVSFNDYSILKDTIKMGTNLININLNNKKNNNIFTENKIIKMNKQINFFKAKFINNINVKNGK